MRYRILVALVFGIALLLRLAVYRHSPYHFDGMMDYLVANHILQFGELPPRGEIFTFQIRSSPLYYYLLSGFLLIRNTPQFLALVNILLEGLSLILMTAIARLTFSRKVSALWLTLISLAPISLVQAGVMIWPPVVAKPVLYSSLFLLLYSFRTGSFRSLLTSFVLLTVAADLYPLYFFILPTYLMFLFAYRSHHTVPLRRMFLLAGCTAALLLALLGPNLLPNPYYVPVLPPPWPDRLPAAGTELLLYVVSSVRLILSELTVIQLRLVTALAVLIAVAGVGMRYITDRNVEYEKKIVLMFLFLLLINYILTVAAFRLNTFSGAFRYFIPIAGLTFLLVSVLLEYLLRQTRILAIVVAVGVLMIVGTNAYVGRTTGPVYLSPPPTPQTLAYRFLAEPLPWIDAIAAEVRDIKERENLPDYRFFTFRIAYGDVAWSDAVFWAPLERSLNTQLTTIFQTPQRDYEILPGTRRYFFLVCNTQDVVERPGSTCETSRTLQRQNDKIVKQVFSNQQISVYLLKSS